MQFYIAGDSNTDSLEALIGSENQNDVTQEVEVQDDDDDEAGSVSVLVFAFEFYLLG